MAQPRTLYEDGRPYTLPDSLEARGAHRTHTRVVELPLRLDWSEQVQYDLADGRQLNVMHQRVIREAIDVEDLRAYLHGPTLQRVWHLLWLPPTVRGLWESRFRSLARAD